MAETEELIAEIRRCIAKSADSFSITAEKLGLLLPQLDALEGASFPFQANKARNIRQADLQIVLSFFGTLHTLKLCGPCGEATISLSKFKKLKQLELVKIDARKIYGLKALRPQIAKLVSFKSGDFEQILRCSGADYSPPAIWKDLRELRLSKAGLSVLELSDVEWFYKIRTLNLSDNSLTNVDCLSVLPCLNTLVLGYNNLKTFPALGGRLPYELMYLTLNNNFLEDISGLRTLRQISRLDLSHNSLDHHKKLLGISHLRTLHFLNLIGNPIYFHPNHRTRTASHLHLSARWNNMVLDHARLSKREMTLMGTFYPTDTVEAPEVTVLMASKGSRLKPRLAVISDSGEEELPPKPIVENHLTVSPRLEKWRQILALRETFGADWMSAKSGSGFAELLGYETPRPPSTSAYDADFSLYSDIPRMLPPVVPSPPPPPPPEEELNEEYIQRDPSPEPLPPDDPDLTEETIYLVSTPLEEDPIFIMIGHTHISEKEATTSMERIRWHVESILSCDKIGEDRVEMRFETMRKDRKFREYIFETEIDQFMAVVETRMKNRRPRKPAVKHKCMKCDTVFHGGKTESVLEKITLVCPSCDSALIIEDLD